MNKEKFQEVKKDLFNLLSISGKSDITKKNREKFDKLIIVTAAELVEVAAEGEKTEMPCNCCVGDDDVKVVKKTLTLDADTKAALKEFLEDIFGI